MDNLPLELFQVFDHRVLGYNFGTNRIYNLIENPGVLFPSDMNEPRCTLSIPSYRANSRVEGDFASQPKMLSILAIILPELCSGRVAREACS